MRRTSESSQQDENPRRRVRRTSSQDRRHSDAGEHVPTSPIPVPFMGPRSGSIPSSPADRVSPHGSGSMMNFSHGLQRGQANMDPSSRPAFPRSVVSPSRYQSSSPVYAPHAFPTSNISTPSCATPTSVTYTVSPRTPDYFTGMQDPSLSPSRPMGDPGFPAQSPNFFPETKTGFPEFSIPSPRDPFSAGPSPGGTMHHHGYPPRRSSVPSPGSAGYPAPQLSPSAKIPRSQTGSAGGGHRGYGSGSRADQPDGSPLKKHPTLKIPTNGSAETIQMRQTVIEFYMDEMETIKANFREKLKEVFFLQSGGNMMDYLVWKRRATPQLLAFLNANQLDDSSSGSTPVATNTVSPLTKIPPSYAWPQPPQDPNTYTNASSSASAPVTPKPVVESPGVDPGAMVRPPPNFTANSTYQRQHSIPDGVQASTSSFANSQASPWNPVNTQTASSQLPTQNPRLGPPHPVQNRNSSSFVTPERGMPSSHHITLLQSSRVNSGVANGPSVSTRPSPTVRTQSLTSVLENSFGSHEDIAMEAKKEAEVLKRVSELRKEGLWTQRRLPKVQEMPRCKAHWDYLLEEMQWLAADFVQERRWKRGIAKKVHLHTVWFILVLVCCKHFDSHHIVLQWLQCHFVLVCGCPEQCWRITKSRKANNFFDNHCIVLQWLCLFVLVV